MPLDAEVASQILTESRESFAQVSRQRAAHVEENATHISHTQINLQALYGASAANLLTGISNQQANTQQALKSAGYFPTVVPIVQTPVEK